jgi:predicted DCC family thiol-disulfide oxidoreductase YuxK
MILEPVTLLYDGACGLCVRAMRVVERLDILGRCRYENGREPRVHRQFSMIAAADLDEAMYAVTASGRIYRGFFAFRRVALALPPAWPLLLLFYFPGATIAGPIVYGWVARRRHSLGCGPSCDVPAQVGESRRPLP